MIFGASTILRSQVSKIANGKKKRNWIERKLEHVQRSNNIRPSWSIHKVVGWKCRQGSLGSVSVYGNTAQHQDVYERSDQEQDSSAELTSDVQGNFRQSRWNGRNSPLSHRHALQWTTNRILMPVSPHFTCYLMISNRLEMPHPPRSFTCQV